MGFLYWFMGVLFGGFIGVVLMAIIQGGAEKEEIGELRESSLEDLYPKEKYTEATPYEPYEPFTYDCLNDPDPDDTDIPKLY